MLICQEKIRSINYNTKSSFLMNNVIPITHSKFEIISLRPRPSIVSPLKTRDSNPNTRAQEYQSIQKQKIIHSAIYQTQNNQFISENSSKKKIVLKKNKQYNSNKKDHVLQIQKSSFISSLRQTHRKLKHSKQHLHISIDLDKIRSEENKLRKGKIAANYNKKDNYQTELKKYQTQNTELTIIQLEKQEETKQDQSIFHAVNLKSTQKKSARIRNSSKQIKEKIFNKSEKNLNDCYRSKSLDTILRNPNKQEQRSKDKDSKKNIVNRKHSNAAPSILTEQQTLKSLFKKLIKKNLPYQNWINYINLTYEELTIDELHFIGILLQRVQPKYLNAMDYLTFKFKIYQNCQKEFQELMYFQQLKR